MKRLANPDKAPELVRKAHAKSFPDIPGAEPNGESDSVEIFPPVEDEPVDDPDRVEPDETPEPDDNAETEPEPEQPGETETPQPVSENVTDYHAALDELRGLNQRRKIVIATIKKLRPELAAQSEQERAERKAKRAEAIAKREAEKAEREAHKHEVPAVVGDLDSNWQELNALLGNGMQTAALFMREMPRAKAAELFGITSPAVTMHLQHAVNKLKAPEHSDLVNRCGLSIFVANHIK